MSEGEGQRVLEALRALRNGARGGAQDRAWTVLYAQLDTWYGRAPGHDETRQVAVLKIHHALDRIEADTPGAAVRFVRTVYRNAENDAHRRRKTQRAVPLEDPPAEARRGRPPLEALEARESWTEAQYAELSAALEDVLDRLEGWLTAGGKRPSARQTAHGNAQLALLARVAGLDTEELAEHLGLDPEASRQTVQKRVQRGRDEVLLPFLDAWIAGGDADPWIESLRALLAGSRRRDAGVERAARRKAKNVETGAVSPGRHRTSVQTRAADREEDDRKEDEGP